MHDPVVLASIPAQAKDKRGHFGVAGAIRARWRRARQRALADAWLAWGAVPREESRLLIPRANELTSAKSRRALAKVCRRYVAESRDPPCRAYATNRTALRTHVGTLERLGTRVGDLSKPASPRSILLVREVLDGNGPLFNRARGDELGPALTRALRGLEEDETDSSATGFRADGHDGSGKAGDPTRGNDLHVEGI